MARMDKIWSDEAWEDYLYWQGQDKKTLKRINALIKDIERYGDGIGIGKPELLKYDYQGWWSRRIDDANRIVYRIENDALIILQCRSHYD
jgi:toxin YoeB